MLATLLFVAAASAAVSGVDPVVEEWPKWPYEAGCYGPPFDPVTVFSGPADAELGSNPGEVALREALSDPALADVGVTGSNWRRVSESQTSAVFVKGALPVPWWVAFERDESGWKWRGSGMCTPRTVLHGLTAVEWDFASEQARLSQGTRRLRILITGGPCNSGKSLNPWVRAPVFRQLGKRLLMTILLEPLPPGRRTCQGELNPQSFVVRLPSRLGNRKLFDGGTYPPRDVVERWRERRTR